MYTIQNAGLTAKITPTGIELASLVDQSTGLEYIWQADPDVWGSHAPVLFPIIGGLKNGVYTFAEKSFQLPKHGMVRRNPNLRVVEHSPDQITFELTTSPATLVMYPFDFRLLVTYQLEGRTLIQQHTVENKGDTPLYFSLGGHPAFRVPLRDGEQYEDYQLVFEHPEDALSRTVNAEGLIGPEMRTVPWEGNSIPLRHELFANDALVFTDLSSRFTAIAHSDRGEILRVTYPDFPFLGVWAKTNGDFVCIEPWLGIADLHDTDGDFTQKYGIQSLAGKESFQASFTIEVA
ncbi:MAG: aldose 1-epimerase family protein [Bacteroidota bacterium]